MAKYGPEAQQLVAKEMKELKAGKLRSGSGQKVTNPKQAIAIALSEARRDGAKMPEPPPGTASAAKAPADKRAARKSTAKKQGAAKAASKKTSAKTAGKAAPAKKTSAPRKAASKKAAPEKAAASRSRKNTSGS